MVCINISLYLQLGKIYKAENFGWNYIINESASFSIWSQTGSKYYFSMFVRDSSLKFILNNQLKSEVFNMFIISYLHFVCQ